MIQLHQFLVYVLKYLDTDENAHNLCQDYLALNISPHHIHKTKAEHKHAIFVLSNTISQVILSKEEGGDELTNQLCPELGILLMKEQITAHHGDIHIEQKKDSGTCVTVFIPMGKEHFEKDSKVEFVEAEPDSQEPQQEVPVIVTAEEKELQMPEEEQMTFSMAAPAPGTKHKILVIEDHKDIRLYMKVLFGANYTVIMAENGEEGVRLARKEMPDIILSDVMMPKMDGFECTRILKEDVKTCHIPIILLTALVGDMDIVKGIENMLCNPPVRYNLHCVGYWRKILLH